MEEMSRLFNVHKNTIRTWLRQGLESIDGLRPIVVRGESVRYFLEDRRSQQKRPCGPGRIYCLPCRAPKVPAGKMAECQVSSGSAGTLCGICPDCNRLIYRRVNPQKLSAVRGDLDVTITQARPRIEETSNPTVNCDSTEGDNR